MASDTSLWELEFKRRYQGIRASLRSLQLELGCDYISKKSASFKRMQPYIENVNAAFDAMNTEASIGESSYDKAICRALRE